MVVALETPRERLTVGSMEGLGCVERTDGDVVPVSIPEQKLRGSGAGIHVAARLCRNFKSKTALES
jgi:molybdate-binding protein